MAFMEKYNSTYQEELDALEKEPEETGFVLFDRQRRLDRIQLEQEEQERKAKGAKAKGVVEYVPQPLGPTTIAVPTYTPTPLSLLTPEVLTSTKPRVKSVVKFAPSALPQLQAALAKLRSQAKTIAAVIDRPLKAATPVRAIRVKGLPPGHCRPYKQSSSS